MKKVFFGFLIIVAQLVGGDVWSYDSFTKMKGVGQVQVSPDGKETVYSLSSCDGSQWNSHLYLAATDGSKQPFQFTRGSASCHSAQWSPDGSKIAFLSARDGVTDIYVIERTGGEAYRVTGHEEDIQGFKWAPNGQFFAFVATQKLDENGICLVCDDEPINNLYRSSLDGKVEQLTQGRRVCGARYFGTGDQDFSFSPDGEQIAFGYQLEPGEDATYMKTQVALVTIATKQIEEVGGSTQCETAPSFSPDGKWLAFVQSDDPATYAYSRYVAVMDRRTKKVRQLSATPNEGPDIGDVGIIGWTADSKAVLFREPAKTLAQVLKVPIDGSAATTVLQGSYLTYGANVNSGGTHLGFTIQDSTHPAEVAVASLKDGKVYSLTTHNQLDASMPRTEVISWKSSDGMTVEGLVTYPTGYNKNVSYPCIVVVHGGPMGNFVQSFTGNRYPYPTAALADDGFVVFRPNPRGSTGYGRAFRNANYSDWGGADFEDIMTGVDSLISRGLVDGEKLGICGWSYGGYMTAWAITQTDRFKVASMGAGLSNMVSFAGTTDIHSFLENYFEGDFPEKIDVYIARSPITHVRNVKTPCLIQHGSADPRVPVSQGEEFYRALKKQGVETELVIYPGMTHGSGTVEQEVDLSKRNMEWFKKHLLG